MMSCSSGKPCRSAPKRPVFPFVWQSPVVEQGMAGKRNEAQYTAKLFRSMSLLRQNRAEDARLLFNDVEGHMPKLPADEHALVAAQRVMNQELLICWMAYKEAREMLKPQQSETTNEHQ